MLSKSILLALAASSVSAQTYTACNPLTKTCPEDPAFGSKGGNCDFSKGACSIFEELPGTSLKYDGNGAVFSISTETEAPTVRTGKYILFGRVDVEVQAAAGAGIVTSSVLQSDDLDEIDWEWVGGDNGQAQSNYFSKGDTTTYNRGAFHPVANPTGQFHKYSVIWTSQMVQWLIDDQVVRTLTAAEANNGATLPQTPMQVKLGTWVAGRHDAAEGTVQWAGGMADFSKAPFLGYYKSISIVDYAGGDGPTPKSVREYIYADHSGTWQSIKVVEGDSLPDTPSSSSSSSSASHTSAHSSSSATHSSSSEGGKTTFVTATPTSASASASSSSSSSTHSIAVVGTGSGTRPTQPATIPSNPATRDSVAFGGVLAAGAGALLAQLVL